MTCVLARWVMLGCLGWALGCGSDAGDKAGDGLTDDGDSTAKRDGGSLDAGSRDARTQPRADSSTDPNLDPNSGTCAAITKDAPSEQGKVDVIWIVDNSPSMIDDILGVTANMQKFFDTIEMSGADVHVITITIGDLALGTTLQADAERYRFVPWNVFSKLVFEPALDLYDGYKDFLRPDAATQFVGVTDDDDVFASGDFISAMNAKLGHDFTFHSIVADKLLCGSAIGFQYLAASDATGGEKISLCDGGDWAAVVDKLTSAVVASVPLPCSYDLADAAKSTVDFDPLEVAVDYTPDGAATQELPKSSSADKCADRAGWYFDDEAAPTKVELCPAACELVKGGGKMAIAFGCAPRVFL